MDILELQDLLKQIAKLRDEENKIYGKIWEVVKNGNIQEDKRKTI